VLGIHTSLLFEGKMMQEQTRLSRRSLVSLIVGAGVLASGWEPPRVFAQVRAPAIITPDARRPAIPHGVASGDVTNNAAII
jgi:alkaline phosphatase D